MIPVDVKRNFSGMLKCIKTECLTKAEEKNRDISEKCIFWS
jgi:hypothetical protein